jgi:hypothetical protein
VSIIYKALQKTQNYRQKETKPVSEAGSRSWSRWIDVGLAILILLLLSIIIFEYSPRIVNYIKTTHSSKPQPAQAMINEAEFKTKYILNGIFISDQAKVAIINNKTVHLGDNVGGLKVIHLGENDVELQLDNQVIILEVPM